MGCMLGRIRDLAFCKMEKWMDGSEEKLLIQDDDISEFLAVFIAVFIAIYVYGGDAACTI
jgi:hypothetical protein